MESIYESRETWLQAFACKSLKEFVNKDGDHNNKIEGHWCQAKAKLPAFGIRKYMFSSYLAEFLWRYEHKREDYLRFSFLEGCKENIRTVLKAKQCLWFEKVK